MNLREALASLDDPRYQNRRYPLWGVVALVLVAFVCRVDSLRGVARFAQANPFLCKPLGLRKAPGRSSIAQLIRRLDPQALGSALQQVFPNPPSRLFPYLYRYYLCPGRGWQGLAGEC
ncbi:transposase family protein [Calidithermus chliarophilus]|uniref:transposase family protein n=1 Tax=Calidithermus chliarophilus TaxID=52023 RepID=UPI0003FFE2EA|nr:transposase family protein [Calidithermus chliarophilus]